MDDGLMKKFFAWGSVFLCLSFILFIIDAVSFCETPQERCNNVVVLTGGKNRIQHALKLIQENQTKNIFISGVHTKTTLNDILDESEHKRNVNFILGKKAKNTFENAEEIDEWVSTNNIKKITLITSDYHMRRSIIVLNHKSRGVKIIPCVSKSNFDFYFLKMCAKEFYKTACVCLKFFFDGIKKVGCYGNR